MTKHTDMIIKAMNNRIALTNLETLTEEEKAEMGDVTHTASSSVSILMNRDALSNATLITGYQHYFREIAIRIGKQATDVLGKESFEPHTVGEILEGTEIFLRRIFGHEKYQQYLSAENKNAPIQSADKCVMLSLFFAIKEGTLNWMIYTTAMVVDTEVGFGFKEDTAIEDMIDVLKELDEEDLKNPDVRKFEYVHTVPVQGLGISQAGYHYPLESLQAAADKANKAIAEGRQILGELRSMYAEPGEKDIQSLHSVDMDRVVLKAKEFIISEKGMSASIEIMQNGPGFALNSILPDFKAREILEKFHTDPVKFGIRGAIRYDLKDGLKIVNHLDIISVDAVFDPAHVAVKK